MIERSKSCALHGAGDVRPKANQTQPKDPMKFTTMRKQAFLAMAVAFSGALSLQAETGWNQNTGNPTDRNDSTAWSANPNGSGGKAANADLAATFRNPPPEARPWVYWFWMNGNITKGGITADLEAMARVGIGGTLIFSVSNGIPPGRVDFLSPKWRELFAHAVREAARLGIEIDMNNADGWTGSGGPWVTPADSMQVLTWNETRIAGPAEFDETLPQPPARSDYYQDIAVLAIPAAGPGMKASSPKITSPHPRFDGASLMDNNFETGVNLPKPSREKPVIVTFEFPKPFTVRSLTIRTGRGHQRHGGRLEASADGQEWKVIHRFSIPSDGMSPSILGDAFKPVTSRLFRLVFDRATWREKGIDIRELDLAPEVRLNNWPQKAGYKRGSGGAPPNPAKLPPLPQTSVHDLTDSMGADGRLRWDVPEGRWLVLRIGHTSTGKKNPPATPKGTGLECDKMSREAIDRPFAGMMAKLIGDAGDEAGNTLTFTHTDSWEVGMQNWTPKLPEEFQARRGYPLRPHLLAMLGYPVVSSGVAERFLWDLRRTLAELIADNYYGRLRELAQEHGMKLSVQAYGQGNFNDLQCAARADMPMSEFWVGRPDGPERGKQPASVAHQLGNKVVGAEAFTANPDHGRWMNHPYKIKALGDAAFCYGINRFHFHRYAMQPWMDRYPGMTFGPHGFHYERTTTWFEQSSAWLQYLARCQYLLRQGEFVGDLLYFIGESEPALLPRRHVLKPPEGYDYDGCDFETLIEHAAVRDGRIAFPGGVSYRLLVLPPEVDQMTPALLKKLKALVEAGAHVLGPKPRVSPSLENFPACDREVARLANELWGEDAAAGKKKTGEGTMYWGQEPGDILAALGCGPDVTWTSAAGSAQLLWIHRRAGDTDIYFVSNQGERHEAIDASFRVTGKQPELWDPATGTIRRASLWEPDGDERSRVRFRLDPRGSVFVVFREPATPQFAKLLRDGKPVHSEAHVSDVPAAELRADGNGTRLLAWKPGAYRLETTAGETRTVKIDEIPEPISPGGPWKPTFPSQPPYGDATPKPQSLEKLISWTEHPDDAVKHFSGTAVYRTTIAIPEKPKTENRKTLLDLGRVEVIAEVIVNGNNLGILWKPPFRVDVTDVLKPGDNTLEVRVTNLWPNRLIGDERKPPYLKWLKHGYYKGAPVEWPDWVMDGGPVPDTGRITFTTWRFFTQDDPLLPSGLLGPVQLRSAVAKEIVLSSPEDGEP